jgi:hypothetical protein
LWTWYWRQRYRPEVASPLRIEATLALYLGGMAGMVLAAGYAALILHLLGRWSGVRVDGLGFRRVAFLFLLKLAAGLLLWVIYTRIYPDRSTADLFKYFDDGMVMYGALPGSPGDYLRMLFAVGNDAPHFDAHYYTVMNNWYRAFETGFYNDAHTMIRYNALLGLLSFGHLPVHLVLSAGVATWGSVLLYTAMLRLAPHGVWHLLVAVFLVPTLVLWPSGPLKENLLLAGMGAFLWGLVPGRTPAAAQRAAALFLGVTLMLLVKSYVLLSLLPGAIGWALSQGRNQNAWSWHLMTHGVLLITLLVMGQSPTTNAPELLARQQQDFVNMARSVQAGSLVELPRLDGTWRSLLVNAPHAVYMTYLSPVTMLGHGLLGTLASLEGILVLVLAIMVLFRTAASRVDVALLLWCLSFLLLLGLLIGWTTPVVGALVRYRLPLLPFVVLAALSVRAPHRTTDPSLT